MYEKHESLLFSMNMMNLSYIYDYEHELQLLRLIQWIHPLTKFFIMVTLKPYAVQKTIEVHKYGEK
jgi:hypothetical protein